ncbi:MAG: hypothetical protein M3N35_01635 [Candidatus Binatota bacterium]|nr:hypothetical protein [Candidatus Binatota bacterium]
MGKLDIGAVIQEAISRFSQNRIGDKPPVFVTLAPAFTQVPWQNQTAEGFVRRFIYETLLTSDPDAPIEISLRRRSRLNDLNAFIGIKPSYWIQLRLSGRGIRVGEKLIDELFGELGFRVEEWVGIDGSDTRLGIFGTIDAPTLKMVFCLESVRHKLKCDLLLPIDDGTVASDLIANDQQSDSVHV